MTPADDDPRTYPDRKPLPDQPSWRRDFPTDVPEDDHVARREFVKFLVLTSGAFAVGQCWIAAASALREKGPFPRTRIGTVAELEERKVLEFRYPDDHEPCLALCLEPGKYVAYGQKCSHLACAVVPHLDRGELHCPCHNGYFEAAGGRPVAGPPRRPLPLVTLEVKDGDVFATGFELRTV
ncbi:MAG TPA: Rieske 2Fe-2S domain-containing protein [Gemmataceae bacterium]|jgi:nitrite reductase/ring-hydroxylating ferredoxin subunit|nr:Rieske 2Fe-2S domain-containing protein [Gemmataceae bacterium]